MAASHAATYITDGAMMGTVDLDRSDYIYKADIASDATNRLYDGGKGRDWRTFASAAYGVYEENDKDIKVFGSLAPNITEGNGSLGFTNLMDDSGHCWAYTGSNMIQYWQSYYGVFANKVGETKNPTPVHGFNYDTAYAATLGGTQQLQLNKLFYDKWNGSYGGTTSTAFDWYLGGQNDSTNLLDKNSGGYFKQYFKGGGGGGRGGWGGGGGIYQSIKSGGDCASVGRRLASPLKTHKQIINQSSPKR